MHDSINFAEQEHFGLVTKCTDKLCKLRGSAFHGMVESAEAVADPEASPSQNASHDGHDCSVGYNSWETSWRKDKRNWCCRHEGKACNMSMRFNCQDRLAIWRDA